MVSANRVSAHSFLPHPAVWRCSWITVIQKEYSLLSVAAAVSFGTRSDDSQRVQPPRPRGLGGHQLKCQTLQLHLCTRGFTCTMGLGGIWIKTSVVILFCPFSLLLCICYGSCRGVLTDLFAILLLDLAAELLWGTVWRGVLPLLLTQLRKCGKVTKEWAHFFVKP